MAKVNYGQTVNDARGKLGGTVFSKNKSGAYTRRKVTPTNPQTSYQTIARASLGSLSQAWSGTLSQPQRDAWIAYAATYPRLDIFGASIFISGLNMFVSLNATLGRIGLPPVLTPPATNVVDPIPWDINSFVAASGGTASFMETAVSPAVTNAFYLFATRPMPPGRQPQKSDFRFLGTLSGIAGPYPIAINFGTPYVSRFGPMATGQKVGIEVATLDTLTGLTTVGTMVSAIVT